MCIALTLRLAILSLGLDFLRKYFRSTLKASEAMHSSKLKMRNRFVRLRKMILILLFLLMMDFIMKFPLRLEAIVTRFVRLT